MCSWCLTEAATSQDFCRSHHPLRPASQWSPTSKPSKNGQLGLHSTDNFRTIFGQFHLRLTNFPCFRHNFGTIGPSFDSRVVPIEISTSNSTKLVQFGPRLTGVSGPVQPILQGGGGGTIWAAFDKYRGGGSSPVKAAVSSSMLSRKRRFSIDNVAGRRHRHFLCSAHATTPLAPPVPLVHHYLDCQSPDVCQRKTYSVGSPSNYLAPCSAGVWRSRGPNGRATWTLVAACEDNER